MRAPALLAHRRKYVAGLAVGVALVLLLALVHSQPRHREAPAATSRSIPLGPVLLVPGYGGSTTSLQPLAARLQAAGRSVRIVALPDGGEGDLVLQADALQAAARRAMAETGARSVDVVGYSAGGVVARLWVAQRSGARIARRIVTLGAPQHGTRVADLAASLAPSQCPLACRQLTTASPLSHR